MKKLFFIISFAIAGSFGLASAQEEQSTTTTTPTEKQSTTYENENASTSPNMQDTKQDETKRKGLFKKKDHSTSEKVTKGKYDGSSTGSSGTGSTTGTGSSTNTEGTYQQGTGTSESGTSGTYQQGTGTTGTGTGTSGTYQQGTGTTGTGTGTSGTYQQGTGTTGTGTGTGTSGTYQQGTTTTPQDRTRTDDTFNQSMDMSQDDEGWTKIGEKTVNLSKDRDEVTVSGSEKFSSIKIRVSDAAMIDLKDVEVEYEGGEKQTVEMDIPINTTTGESKVIDLESSDQNVKKITFDYKKRATIGRAHV